MRAATQAALQDLLTLFPAAPTLLRLAAVAELRMGDAIHALARFRAVRVAALTLAALRSNHDTLRRQLRSAHPEFMEGLGEFALALWHRKQDAELRRCV